MTQDNILGLLVFLLRITSMGLVSNLYLRVLSYIVNVKIDL